MKYIISLEVPYIENIWIEADDQEKAVSKVLANKGVRLNHPVKIFEAEKKILEIKETVLTIRSI